MTLESFVSLPIIFKTDFSFNHVSIASKLLPNLYNTLLREEFLRILIYGLAHSLHNLNVFRVTSSYFLYVLYRKRKTQA